MLRAMCEQLVARAAGAAAERVAASLETSIALDERGRPIDAGGRHRRSDHGY